MSDQDYEKYVLKNELKSDLVDKFLNNIEIFQTSNVLTLIETDLSFYSDEEIYDLVTSK